MFEKTRLATGISFMKNMKISKEILLYHNIYVIWYIDSTKIAVGCILNFQRYLKG